jgi:ankyrin repeat protein
METLVELGAIEEAPDAPDELAKLQANLGKLAAARTKDGDDVEEEDDDESIGSEGHSLLVAAIHGNAAAVEHAIADGVDVNYQNEEGRTALMVAIAVLGQVAGNRKRQRDQEQVIDALLRAGADPNRGAIACLPVAAMTHRPHLIHALLRAGAALNASFQAPTSEDGSNTATVNALMIALSPRDGVPPANELTALTLIEAGIALDFQSDDGAKAIHFAAQNGMTLSLEAMLKRAPELADVRDAVGRTPLMWAVEAKQLGAIAVLRAAGADLGVRDSAGRTAAEIAEARGDAEVVEALRS